MHDHVILLKRNYCEAKSFSLTRKIISFSSPPDGPASPYVAVFYQTTAKISNDSKIFCHSNTKKRVSLEKPYIRTNDQILSKARKFIDKGQNKRKIKSIKKQVNFFSVHHKARSSETRNKYTARKQSRSLLKMKTMNLNCS